MNRNPIKEQAAESNPQTEELRNQNPQSISPHDQNRNPHSENRNEKFENSTSETMDWKKNPKSQQEIKSGSKDQTLIKTKKNVVIKSIIKVQKITIMLKKTEMKTI